MREYWVYIVANIHRTLYIVVTNNLAARILEHHSKLTPGFTSKYAIDRLVYCESTGSVYEAIAREKQLKGWFRRKKIALIESVNPRWDDLAAEWFDAGATDPSLRPG
jgi:putative endonuclease